MGAALGKKHTQEPENAKDKLAQAFREALASKVKSTVMLDQMVESLMDAVTGRFIVGVRKPKPRRETHRALMRRLPDVGTKWTYQHKEIAYNLQVVGEHAVAVWKEHGDGKEIYESLKAAAIAILGYVPSVGGWQFFFGSMSREEVQERYGDR